MSARLDLRLLRQYLAVCDAGSMKAAGERGGISTAAVSKTVAVIEAELGVTLFERGPAGLRLTPAGARLREQSREVLEQFDDMVAEVETYRAQLVPRLRLYIVESVAAFLLPGIITALKGRVGELTLESGLAPSYGDDLLRGRFDIIIGGESLAEMPGVEQYVIAEEPLVLVCPASVAPGERSVEGLASRLPLIRFAKVRRMDQLAEAHLAARGLDLPRVLDCSTAPPLVALIGQGLGFALTTPLSIAFTHPDPERIAMEPLPEPAGGRRITLNALRGRLGGLPAAIAAVCRDGLARDVMPLIRRISPAVADLTVVAGGRRPRAAVRSLRG